MALTPITGEPYELQGRRLAFANWHYVRPASFGWFDERNQNVSVGGDQGPRDARFCRNDDTFGISLKVHLAKRTGPLIRIERPWEEGGIGIGNVLQAEGMYRAWTTTGWGDLKSRGSRCFVTFESLDGLNWMRPSCGIRDFNGNRNNNILHEFGGTVFIDPMADSTERYKWISEAHFPKDVYEEYVRHRPDAVDPRSNRRDAGLYIGVRGAVSPDGYHWTVIERPLVMHHSDTQSVAYYDTRLKKYVAYLRDYSCGEQAKGYPDYSTTWISVGRRAIARSETEDFREFPVGDLIIEPPPWMSFGETLYTNCRTTVPKAPDVQLMFPAVWDQATDSSWIALASGHDGKAWSMFPNIRLLETGPFGEWDGGCVFASPDLIELPNGDFALPYTGYDVPHKYPRKKAQRGFGYALWPKGRLIGIEAKERGAFSTVAVVSRGRKISINSLTSRAGSILCEVAGLDGKAIPGREFANAIPVIGDCHNTPIAWKGCDTIGVDIGTPVILKFRMAAGTIYFVDFICE